MSVQHSLDELHALRKRLAILPLFRTLFPRAFRETLKKTRTAGIQAQLEHLIERFVQGINQKYFPADDCDLEFIIDQFPHISLPLINFDVESEFEDVPVPERITAALVGSYSYAPSRHDIQHLIPDVQLPICWLTDGHWCDGDMHVLTKLCEQHPAPITHFPMLFRTLNHDTGSIFLDATYDTGDWGHDYLWNYDTVIELKTQWTLTKRILSTNRRTLHALERTPSHWNTIFRCWAAMCHHARSHEASSCTTQNTIP